MKLDMNSAEWLYMLESLGETGIVTTRMARINKALDQLRRGYGTDIIQLLAQQNITDLSETEMDYVTNRLLEVE